MLKVTIESAEPAGVKISRKNIAIISITAEKEDKDQREDEKLLEFFMQEQKPSWKRQFKAAILLGPMIEDNIEIEDVKLSAAITHFFTVYWNFIFAVVPPVHWGGGWPAFAIALTFIGVITLVVAEVAILFGCVMGIPNSVTGITIVALGTSLPDTFASVIAAKTGDNADAAIGNVTGSNCVNVFLGMGAPWVLASSYMASKGKEYVTPAGNVAFSVIVFLICTFWAMVVLCARRKYIKGELGGPKTSAIASCLFLVFLWILYATLSIIKSTSDLL